MARDVVLTYAKRSSSRSLSSCSPMGKVQEKLELAIHVIVLQTPSIAALRVILATWATPSSRPHSTKFVIRSFMDPRFVAGLRAA